MLCNRVKEVNSKSSGSALQAVSAIAGASSFSDKITVPINGLASSITATTFDATPGSSVILLDEAGNQQVLVVSAEPVRPLGKRLHEYALQFFKHRALD